MMKRLFTALSLCAVALPTLAASTLASWNFNTDDGLVSTGTLLPSEGAGTLSLVGGANGLFASGSPFDPAGFPLDSAWSVGGFPDQGMASGTVGWQGFVSTAGYRSISVAFDYQTQASGNKWFLLQSSADHGASWADVSTLDVASADHWYSASFDVSSVHPAANDETDFGFRLVAIFKPGTSQYEAAEAGYNGDFGLVLDRLTVQATPVPEAHAVWLALAGLASVVGLFGRRIKQR